MDLFDAWVRDYIRKRKRPPSVAEIMTFLEACASVRIDHDREGTYAL